MKVNELQVSKNRAGRRVGRGISAGRGKTAGRGTKGYGSRTGSKRKPGFEGGQNPLMQRLPKVRGFRSHKIKTENVYTGQINEVKGTVTNLSLFEADLISSPYTKIKLIARGEITKKLTVKLQAASKPAIEAIQKAGGSFEVIEQVARVAKKSDDK